VGRDTPTSSAISVLDTPSAANSTIRARCAKPARIELDRVQDSNNSGSPDRRPSGCARTPHSRAFHCQTTLERRTSWMTSRYSSGSRRVGRDLHPHHSSAGETQSDSSRRRRCHTSTRFSHDPEVGVKWIWILGVGREPGPQRKPTVKELQMRSASCPGWGGIPAN